MGMRAILTGVTVSLVASGVTYAADIKGPGDLKDVPYVETAWNWSGFYGGVTAGYGSGTSRNYVSPNANNPHGWAENDPDGALLGVTVGYNWLLAPNWVVGAEADFSWSGMEGEQHKYIYDGHDWSGGWDGLSTIRGRLGYAAGPNLFYGTAGLALLHANETIVGNDASESNFYQGWKAGYVIGAGIEHAFSNRLTAKIEYLYADGFSSESGYTGTVSQRDGQTYIHDVGNISIIRAGLNYKF
ncbi:MAG: outer membrane beta-barrel protein [Rhodomicrobium sp.]|jgi:outer membrane immunogenic protein